MHVAVLNYIVSALAEESGKEPIILNYIWLIPALPLVAFIVNGLFGRMLKKTTGLIAVALVGISFLLAVLVLIDVNNRPEGSAAFQYTLYTWIPSGDFHVNIAFLVDPLTAIMLIVVLGVGSLVHIYSIGYMEDDPDFARFFTFLPLFVFSMLMLVLSNNFLLLYVGWEAVGLCSYLIIGFWFYKKSASDAAKKAFIVNRIGDFGFGLGIMMLFVNFANISPDLTYTGIFDAATHQPMM